MRAKKKIRGAVFAGVLAMGLCACSGRSCAHDSGSSATTTGAVQPAPSASGPSLSVPRIDAAITCDGELDEEAWRKQSARTGPFRDGGKEARPYSDARFLRDDKNLYVALYAADEDIHSSITEHDGPAWVDDAFTTTWSTPSRPGEVFHLDVNAAATIADAVDVGGRRDITWESHAKAGVDHDGTPNDSRDLDEEWVIEMAIPLASFGPQISRMDVSLSRCDTPKSGGKRCGSWQGTLLLGVSPPVGTL